MATINSLLLGELALLSHNHHPLLGRVYLKSTGIKHTRPISQLGDFMDSVIFTREVEQKIEFTVDLPLVDILNWIQGA